MERVFLLTVEHLQLSLMGVLIALLVAIPLGIFIYRYKGFAGVVLSLTDVIQTIPSLAMLALLMLVFGLGNTTVIAALVLYSLLPIVRNTYTGLNNVSPSLIEAGRGMGMTRFQRLRYVELPLALPVIMAGIRVATVTAIGIATIGVLIGGGGLGVLIWRGIQNTDTQMILMGSIPAALLAILADFLLGKIEKRLIPKGMN